LRDPAIHVFLRSRYINCGVLVVLYIIITLWYSTTTSGGSTCLGPGGHAPTETIKIILFSHVAAPKMCKIRVKLTDWTSQTKTGSHISCELIIEKNHAMKMRKKSLNQKMVTRKQKLGSPKQFVWISHWLRLILYKNNLFRLRGIDLRSSKH